MAVHTDVRDAAAGPDELGAELERLRHADRLDRNVGAESLGQLHDASDGSSVPLLIVDVRSELERLLETRVGEVDRDDAPRREAASRS